jgi:4'-phosphopantetheinyl transferase
MGSTAGARLDAVSSYEMALGPSRLGPAARAEALAMLSATERARHNATPVPVREQFLAGRSLLRTLAAQQLGIAPAEVPLVARCPDCGGPHGQPGVEGSTLRVSLSHGGGAVVAVAAWDHAIGVDVERAEASPQQEEAILAVAAGHGIRHWTRVEATLKADGRGLRVDPREVEIDTQHDGMRSRVADRPTRYELFEPDVDASLQVTVALALSSRE